MKLLAYLLFLIFYSIFAPAHADIQTTSVYITNQTATVFNQSKPLETFSFEWNKKPFTQDDLKDKWTFIFFGYAQCQDICPLTLNLLNTVYMQASPKQKNLQVVFISVDPKNDTETVVKRYVQQFNKKFIGLTGKPEDIEQLKKQFGIFANATDHQIEHTNAILLINPKGEWQAIFPFNMKPQDMLVEFNQVVSGFHA